MGSVVKSNKDAEVDMLSMVPPQLAIARYFSAHAAIRRFRWAAFRGFLAVQLPDESSRDSINRRQARLRIGKGGLHARLRTGLFTWKRKGVRFFSAP